MRTNRLFLALAVVLGAAGVCSAATLNVPGTYSTIQDAVNAAAPGDTILVAAGTYTDVTVSGKAGLSILGAGAGTTSIVGSHLSGPYTVLIVSSPNTTLAGFTITRSGNNPTEWSSNAKSYGLNVSSSNGSIVRDNVITGNRNGLYMENNDAVTVRNNVIDNNRTGMHLVAFNTNCTVVENTITNNWTDGVLFRTESVANNTAGTIFKNNNISGNWYGQIEYREDFVSLGKDFSGNWLGTLNPTISAVSGGEPGYAGQIPVVFGGASVPPLPGPGVADIKGNASNQFDVTPMLTAGTDTDVETTLGRGTNGFQGAFSNLTVSPQLAQTGATGRIQEGLNLVTASTVNVLPGTYDEDVIITLANTNLLGAGSGVTTIRGPIGGPGSTVAIAASNVTLAGFTITRLGNTLADWNNPNLNTAAVAIQGLAVANATIRDNIITQCRTGIDINNSNGHTVRNNDITDNRTGMILRNQTDNLTIVENNIANNWTVGLVFLDASGGSNSPIQTAANCNISNNNISSNWYGQVVDRQTGGSLPAPGANLKNFSGNWWGTTTPVITVANSAEPGYGAQIPVAFGGAATPPGGQPDICGAASANFDITPMLNSGADTNVETTLGRGTNGFQGDFSALRVTPLLAQVETGGRIQEGINRVTNSTVYVDAGLFTEVVNLNKVGVKVIGAGVGSTIINYQGFTQPGGFNGGVYSATDDVELRDLTVTRTATGGAGPASPRYGIKFDFADGMLIDNVQVTNSYRSGLDLHGTLNVSVNDVTSTGNGGAGIFMTDVKGADLSNITTSGNPWVGVSVSTSGQYAPLGTSDVVFSGVNSFGESAGDNGGLQLEMFKFGFPTPDPITWSSDLADGANVTIQAADFGYALSSAAFDVAATRYVRFHQSLAQAQSAAAGNADHLVAGGRYIQVADDSNGLPGSGPTDLYVFDTVGDKMSIQAAIDGASTTNTDTIHIGAGSYVGSVSTAGRSVILSAGASPAQVTVGGNLTLDSDDTLPIELTGTNPSTQFDNFIVNGVVTLGGATLNVSRTFAPSIGTQFKIIDNDSNDPVVGTFNGLAEGAVFYVTGKPFKITYQGGSGNDVVLIAQDAGTLEVVYDKSCYKPGDTLTATVRMKNLSGPAAGFQAFLAYNPARLTFTSTPPSPAIYTPAPFGLPVLDSPALVNPSSGILNLASGINQLGGQSPSSADADLAILKFTVLGTDTCSIGGLITFRPNSPPTRLTDINGQELAVLTTVDGPAITIDGTDPVITCPADHLNVPNDLGQCHATVAVGTATATDNCGATISGVRSDFPMTLADTYPVGVTTITWTAVDCTGNMDTCVQTISVLDNETPVIACNNSNITVDTDSGVCSALVTWNAATATDNCDPSPTIEYDIDLNNNGGPADMTQAGNSFNFPKGTHKVTARATDHAAVPNTSSCSFLVTVEDHEDPVVTHGAIGTCYTGASAAAAKAAAEAAAAAATSATDNCSDFAYLEANKTIVTTGTVDGNGDICAATITVTYYDESGNSTAWAYSTRIDHTPPVITCAADVVVTPPIGVCSAAAVNLGSTTATDVCTGSVAPVGVRSDSLPLSDPYPQGVTSILWTATDDCGNSSNCTQYVTVNGSTINVTVELSPIIDDDDFPDPIGSLTRCITFEVWDCAGPTMQTTSVVMTFSDDGFGRAIAVGSICVPISTPTCITARDRLHTLRSTVVPTGAAPTFAASFTGKRADEPGAVPMVDVGHRLVGGNLNDDIFIDILDFGTWAGLYLTNYGNGNTTCGTPSPHADISGNGTVDSGDYTFFAINFLMVAENNCCSMAPIMAGGEEDDESPTPRDGNGPRTSITVAELNQLGLSHLAAGDVNHDGVLNQLDMAAVMGGQMPTSVTIDEVKGGDGFLPNPTRPTPAPTIRPRSPRPRG